MIIDAAATAPTYWLSSENKSGMPSSGLDKPRYAVRSRRRRRAKPAALDTTAKKAVTGVGAPWYTSGAHMWNGAAAILKATPTTRRKKATYTR